MAKNSKERKEGEVVSNDEAKRAVRRRQAGDVLLGASGDELTAGVGQTPLDIEARQQKGDAVNPSTEADVAEMEAADKARTKQYALASAGGGTIALEEKPRVFTTPLISKRRHVTLPQWATAWLVLIPALIFLVLFMFYPIINTFFMAFIQDFRWVKGAGSFAFGNFIQALSATCQYMEDGVCTVYNTTPSFGFNNFAIVLSDSVFPKTIWNTFELVIIEVPLTIIISLLIATFLNSIKALRGVYQTIFFLPYVTNTIALGLVFNLIFSSGSGGIMNIILGWFGVSPINWLSPSATSTSGAASRFSQGVVIVTYAIWNGLAFKILVFMSGLATIDKQYYDAAKIDGSSRFTIWRRITLPLLSPQILYITITSFIGAFKMYTGVMAVYSSLNRGAYYFGGDYGEEWMPVVGWIYKQLDDNYDRPGIAAAGSLVLLAIILAITVLQFAVSKKRVHY